MPFSDPEKRKAYHKAYSAKYNGTEKARKQKSNYKKTPAGKAAEKRYYSQERVRRMKAAEQKARNERNPEAMVKAQRKCHLRRKFGITLDQYAAMLEKQGGVCAVCHKPETRIMKGTVASLSVDHCHKTGKNRELLCYNCNTALGLLREDSTIIANLNSYILRHKEKEL